MNTSGSQSGTHTGVYAPHGDGDGSTTFNVPDLRGRVSAGRDDMGGSSANRLTNQTGGLDGDVLGAAGGVETHALTSAQVPSLSSSGNFVTTEEAAPASEAFSGTGSPHNNVQPTIILNKIIYAAA